MLRRGVKHLSRVNDVLFRRLRIERDITIFPDEGAEPGTSTLADK